MSVLDREEIPHDSGKTLAHKIAIPVLLALLLAGLFVAGYWPRLHAQQALQQQAMADPLPRVVFVPAQRAKPTAEIVLPATVRPQREATLYARASGYARLVHADIGDAVKAGQVLAELDAPEHEKELQQLQAHRAQIKTQLELARITAERYRALLRSEAASPQEVDEKSAAWEARKADLAAADANIRRLEELKQYLKVTAPFAGTIAARNVEVGSLVQAGSASSSGWLFRLVDSETLRIQVSVPQSQLPGVQKAGATELVVPELGYDKMPIQMSRNAGVFDSATRTMLFELSMQNRDHRVAPGMYGQVRFSGKDSKPPLVVPVSALIVGGDGLRLATVDERDHVRIKAVKVGRDFGKELEILSGVIEGERVINSPRDTLSDGDRVMALPQPKHEEKKTSEEKKPPGTAKPEAKS